jgi:hypothetical protein
MNGEGARPKRYEIQGRAVTLPVEVRDASAAVATYLVPAEAAQRLLGTDAFEVARVLPGRALLSLAAIDYRDNDLGDYDEVSIAFFARPRGAARGLPWLGAWLDFARGALPTFIQRLPVNQAFTCEAGRTIWGFPKTVEEIAIDRPRGAVRCTLRMDGEHVLTLTAPRGGRRRLPERELTTLSVLEGVPHATRAVQSAEGVGFFARGVRLELGTHPVADELRALGLPRRALFAMWAERLRARFDAPGKL